MFDSEFLTPSADSRRDYQRLIAQIAQIVCESLPSRPYSGKAPKALAAELPPEVLSPQAVPSELIAETLRKVIANSIAISNPRTAAHLHCPPLLASLAAEVVISTLNQSMDSFDQAPFATIIEQRMIRWLCSEFGFSSAADGTLTAGGSQSNYMGLLLARDTFLHKHWNWSAKKAGLPPEAGRLRILCSEVAHFTVEKSAAQLGLGTDSVVRVDVDDNFRMRPVALRDALENLSKQSLLLMAVVATAGTTDFGSIDPLNEVHSLARESNAWVHVDAAYGGALLFGKHRSQLEGIEAADSITIDFHKLFWQPIPCSALLVRDAKSFDSIKLHSDYLNPEVHEEEGIPNLVTTSLLTSRRFDALKLWISFQSLGREKLGAMIEQTMHLADHAARVIRSEPDLKLMCEPQLSTVVFRYVSDKDSESDRINSEIRRRLFDDGLAVIGHTRVGERQCLKLTCLNPSATEKDMEDLVGLVRSAGEDILQLK